MSYSQLEVQGVRKDAGEAHFQVVRLTSEFIALNGVVCKYDPPYKIDFMLAQDADEVVVGVGNRLDVLVETVNPASQSSIVQVLPIGRAALSVPSDNSCLYHRVTVLPSDRSLADLRERRLRASVSAEEREQLQRQWDAATAAELLNRWSATLPEVRDQLPRLLIWGDGQAIVSVMWFANRQHEFEFASLPAV